MDRAKTIEECDLLLSEHPENASLYYERGLLYLRQKAWVEARVNFKKFVELQPSIADGYNNLAITYFQCQDYVKANACWEAARQRDPQSSVYFKNQILVLEKLKNFDQALSLINQRIFLFPQEEGNILLRTHFLGLLGQTREQIKDISKVLQAHPDKHSIRAKRALLFETLGEKEKSKDDLRLLMSVLSSIDNSLQRSLIFLAARLQEYETVLLFLEVFFPVHKNNLELIRLGVWAALALKRNDLALSYLSQGWDTTHEETLLLQRAELHLEMCKEDLALQDLELYRQNAASDVRQSLLRIRVYLQMEQWEKALDETKTTLDLESDNLEALQKQAFILGHLEHFEEAKIIFETILKQKPDDISSRYNRGLCLLNMSQEKEALEDFSKTLLLEPTHLEARQHRANVYFGQKLWKKAASDFYVLLEKEPKNTEYWLKLATSEFHEAHLTESQKHYAKAKILDPKLPDYEYYFAEDLSTQGLDNKI